MLPMNAEFTEWKTDAFMNQATTAGLPYRLFPGFSRATGSEKSSLFPVTLIREMMSSLVLSRLV